MKGFKQGFEDCYVPRDYQKQPCEYVEDREEACKLQNKNCSAIRGTLFFLKNTKHKKNPYSFENETNFKSKMCKIMLLS